MEYLRVTKDNIEKEHICCAISNNKDIQISSKKAWMNECFDDGLVFLRSVERGKCFIEYVPAENAWVPIIANNYLYIDCFWISGCLKGHGYADDLLQTCINEAKEKGKDGLCVLSSEKKRPFLSDPNFLAYKGFKVADESDVGINLMYLPFTNNGVVSKFENWAKHPHCEQNGFVLYYTSQCPFNGKYVPLIESAAQDNKIPFTAIQLKTKQQARKAPTPCTTYALFYNGQWLTNEQCSVNKFLKLAQERQQ